MFKIFGKKKASTAVYVAANLKARLMPLDRGKVEDRLEELMMAAGVKMRVVGGGTLQSADGELAECDIEMEFDDPSPASISLLIQTLQSLVAPKGSTLDGPSGIVDIGLHEGLALYLNATDLAPEVYLDCSFDTVWKECTERLGDAGRVLSFWQGPTETALYIYGSSFNEMRRLLDPFLEKYPLCQKSRVQQIA